MAYSPKRGATMAMVAASNARLTREHASSAVPSPSAARAGHQNNAAEIGQCASRVCDCNTDTREIVP